MIKEKNSMTNTNNKPTDQTAIRALPFESQVGPDAELRKAELRKEVLDAINASGTGVFDAAEEARRSFAKQQNDNPAPTKLKDGEHVKRRPVKVTLPNGTVVEFA